MKGLVIKGSRNLFSVRSFENNKCFECGIKGKILKCETDYYNPLAPGDVVCFEANNENRGMIISVEGRRSIFTRCNRKGLLPQILASNIDILACVTTPASPPFRPCFIDRVLVQADFEQIPSVILLNKIDIGADVEAEERITDYAKSGYNVLRVSALTGAGMDGLRELFAGKNAALTGQSGVGKSSLINALHSEANLKTGRLNEKYDRGSHTTVQPLLLEFESGGRQYKIVDMPGLRQFMPNGIKAGELIFYMREFAPLAGKCAFGLSCSHMEEKSCAVKDAVECGNINKSRYGSLLRIEKELRLNLG